MAAEDTKETGGEAAQVAVTGGGVTFADVKQTAENYYKFVALLPVMAAFVFWVLFRIAHYLHPYLGLLLAIAPVCLALVITRRVSRREIQIKHPTYMMLGWFGVIVALGIVGFASISHFLYSSGLAHFEHANPEAQGGSSLPPDFPPFYLWHFLKLLPIGIEDAWGEPLKHSGAGAGLPLVLFRVMIIVPLLALFKKWRDEKKKAKEKEAQARAARQTVAASPARIETGNV